MEPLMEAAFEAELFDCRNLNVDFVGDTGQAVFEDAANRRDQLIRLPHPACYFEFGDNFAVLALEQEFYYWPTPETITDADVEAARERSIHLQKSHLPADQIAIKLWAFANVYDRDQIDIFFAGFFSNTLNDGGDEPPPFYSIDYIDEADRAWDNADDLNQIIRAHEEPPVEIPNDVNDRLSIGGERLLAILTLMSDKLVSVEYQPDPAPQLTKAREKRGRLPTTSAMHIVTINVAAVRRVTRGIKLGTHESPCLHWRRGHDRVLHRGSEFEKKIWINRMLVGDPDRGYASKQYRVKHEMPLIKATPVPKFEQV